MFTEIKETRTISGNWASYIMVNESDKSNSYQMSIHGTGLEDGTSLDWILRYGKPEKKHLLSACSVMDSYEYLLSDQISQKEALNRLKMLRKAHADQKQK